MTDGVGRAERHLRVGVHMEVGEIVGSGAPHDDLLDRAKSEPTADEGIRLCRGPLLSRAQYLVDVERWNYVDAREVPLGTMTPEEIDIGWNSRPANA